MKVGVYNDDGEPLGFEYVYPGEEDPGDPYDNSDGSNDSEDDEEEDEMPEQPGYPEATQNQKDGTHPLIAAYHAVFDFKDQQLAVSPQNYAAYETLQKLEYVISYAGLEVPRRFDNKRQTDALLERVEEA